MPLQRFRSFEIAEDPTGAALELWRTDREVVCLASLAEEHRWVELHVVSGVDTHDTGSRPAVQTFRSLAQSWRQIRNRRVLELVETGEDEGALFYVTEFVDGETLDAYLARCAPVPAWWAIELARQLTLALLALRGRPDLLARTQVFNARLTLEGDETEHALVRLAEFGLGCPNDPPPDESLSEEARAVQEVGRLLGYAVSGWVVEPTGPRLLSGLPIPPEVSELLGRLLNHSGRPTAFDLPGLLGALTACALTPGLPAVPVRLPPALQPRLPLASHFATLPRLAAELGSRFRLERTPFDASQPYAQRAFSGAAPVTVQLMPPPRLMAPRDEPLIREAAAQWRARPTPHAVPVLEFSPGDEVEWFIEEGPPRLTLHLIRRLRRHLTPAEAAFLLREWHRAVLALESRGLPPAALCPQEIFVEFEDASTPVPGDDRLAGEPVYSWPSFRLKMRAHPTAVHLAQPRRFVRERLVDPCPPRRPGELPPGPPAGLGPPTAADTAALFAWLCGGLSAVPRELSELVQSALDGSRPVLRDTVVDATIPLVPKPSRPAARSKGPGTGTSTSAAPASGKNPTSSSSRRAKKSAKSVGKLSGTAAETSLQIPPPPDVQRSGRPVVQSTPAPVAAPFLVPPPETGWLDPYEAITDPVPGGFAEVLLGSPSDPDSMPHLQSHTLFHAPFPAHEPTDDLPVGALFNPSAGGEDAADPAPTTSRPTGFSTSRPSRPGPSLGQLMLLVVLVALLIAALMAHLTGLAPWR